MKKYIIGGILGIAVLFASCKKEGENIFNMFDDVQVTYHSTSPYSVVDHKEVNVDDSLYIDFTITSTKKSMYQVCVWEAGAAVPFLRFKPSATERNSYSNVVKLKMNSKAGLTSYRVWALDSAGVFIGDGYKTLSVYVTPDYTYLPNRYMYVPDTTAKTARSFISLRTGELFNYNEAAANQDKVDAFIAYDPTQNSNKGAFVIYALDATIPFTPYNFSAWNKRAVRFSSIKNNQASAFINNLRTGVALQSNTGSPTAKSVVLTRTSGNDLITAGQLVYFKTPEGKSGAFIINYTTGHSAKEGTLFNVDVKIQN
jgi:hypothetical protein